MNITIYTITYNEEKMLPFFLDYYSTFASKIVIYDNESTDNTVEIAKKHPLVDDVYSVSTGDCLDDSMYIRIKNSCWKEDKSDYVILVDTDELIYHDNGIVEYLEKTKYPVYRPTGFNMVSNKFPKVGSLITEQIKTGIPDHYYNKPVIFNPNLIEETQFELGTHNGIFINNNQHILPIQSELKMLHYKNLSFDYRIKRHKMFSKRISEFNQRTGAGVHYTWDEQTQRNDFDNCLINSKEVI